MTCIFFYKIHIYLLTERVKQGLLAAPLCLVHAGLSNMLPFEHGHNMGHDPTARGPSQEDFPRSSRAPVYRKKPDEAGKYFMALFKRCAGKPMSLATAPIR